MSALTKRCGLSHKSRMATTAPDNKPTDAEKALERQIAMLEHELAANPTYRQLQVLRHALAELKAIRSPEGFGVNIQRHDVAWLGSRTASSIPQAARFALEDNKKPTTTQELLGLLPKYGKRVGGKNPLTGLSNTLSSDNAFISIRWGDGKAWWLADQPVPASGQAQPQPQLEGVQ